LERTTRIFFYFAGMMILSLGIILTGHPIGIGIGTVAAVIGVGRFIYLYNSLFKDKQLRLTGGGFKLRPCEGR